MKEITKLKSNNKNTKVDLTFQYLDELEKKGWNNYQLGNHGLFYLYNFSQSICIHGINIFQRKLIETDYYLVKKSLLFQIQEYFWRLDNFYLKTNNNIKIQNHYIKYLIRIVCDILLFSSDISFSEINIYNNNAIADFIQEFNYFSIQTKSQINKIFNSDSINLTEIDVVIDVKVLQKLQRFLYLDYLELYQKFNTLK